MRQYKVFLPLILSSFLSLITISTASANVVTSIKPLAFISAAITDGVTETEVLLPDGASPHAYSLKPSDMVKLKKAELVVWISPELEAYMSRPVSALSAEKVITLTDDSVVKANLRHGHQHDEGEEHEEVGHSHSDLDLHIWLSPTISRQIAVVIHDKLITLYPEQKSQLDNNLQEFLNNLTFTEQNVKNRLKPFGDKGYFVFHDAYQYFERYFGLNHLGHFTINPEIQPGVKKLYEIKQTLIEQKAKCVFAEPQFRPAIIDTLTRDVNVSHGILDPLGMNINVTKHSYTEFLNQLSTQFSSCLEE